MAESITITNRKQQFLREAEALLPSTVDLRRRIHQQPELGNDLPLTKATVLESLDGLDLDIYPSKSTSGVIAILKGNSPGPSILLRGDMDALPMPEDTGLEYASKIENRMHACGHDAHTAMLSSAARLLSTHRDRLAGQIKFMFQPGEEGPGGAEPMIREGLLDRGGPPDAAFALHIEPNLRSGLIACRPGPFLASADTVSVKIIGRGGHGSMPHKANDPIPVACELVQAFQTLITRRIKTFDPVVLTVGRIQAGTTSTVIPEHAELVATLRSFSNESRTIAREGIARLAEHIAHAHDMRAEVAFREGYPSTRNDADFVSFLKRTTLEYFGEDTYVDMSEPYMGAEDFSLVLRRVPGAMAFLGVAPDGGDPKSAAPFHSNRMIINENAMAQGVALHAAVAYEYLNQKGV